MFGVKLIEQNFPIETQVGVFQDEQDIENWIWKNNTPFFAYDYIYLIRYAPFVYSNFTQECLVRYNMQKNGYQNFSNIVDEVPGWWVDIFSMMEDEFMKAQKLKAKNG